MDMLCGRACGQTDTVPIRFIKNNLLKLFSARIVSLNRFSLSNIYYIIAS